MISRDPTGDASVESRPCKERKDGAPGNHHCPRVRDVIESPRVKSSTTVFVCGTYSDLSEERGVVLDAIQRLQLRHHSMEFFGARPERPIETCLSEVRESDIVVVIVGGRMGRWFRAEIFPIRRPNTKKRID